MHAARARSDVSSTSRRSKRSAITPAGIDSRMYGSRRAAPTMPRTIAFCVSWYTSTTRATRYSQSPIDDTNSPMNRRVSGPLRSSWRYVPAIPTRPLVQSARPFRPGRLPCPSHMRGPVTATRHQSEPTMSADSVAGEGDALYCYRHPDREVFVRCGRCDRPICTGCAMLGPVGMRCKACGKPAYDPLTSFTARQLVLGLGVAIVGGTVAAFIASRIGFFSIIVSFFAGGLVAQAVVRVTGFKQGPRMLAVVFGGIATGALIGFGLDVLLTLGDLNAIAAEVAAEAGEDAAGQSPIASLVGQMATWALVSAGATCAGAWSRLR